ncbi:MAG TPA: AAA family ATPase [Kofleriaceae bacterium]|nr:AAA family ATPase [Kofleriaceae bacterium]
MRRISSGTASHVAAERCSIVASPDGSHAAIVEPGRIVVVELEHGAQVAEVGVATTPEHTDVAWIGAPPRLLVLSRRATHSTVHLIDLDGPRARAEIQIEGMMRIGATVGAHALVIGTSSTAVLTAGEAHLTPYQFLSRSVPSTAGVAARQFVVAVAGAIEEWDPQQRTPRKRLRLPRAAAIAQVGGTERVVWVTTHGEPAQIDVIAQVHPALPRVHELPEPIAHVSAHPQRELLACLGRDSGSVYIVDLEGRAAVRTLELPGMPRADAIALFAGPTVGVVAARAGEPIGVFALDGRAAAPAASAPVPGPADARRAPAPAPAPPAPAASPAASSPDPALLRRSSLFDAPLARGEEASSRTPSPGEPAAAPRPRSSLAFGGARFGAPSGAPISTASEERSGATLDARAEPGPEAESEADTGAEAEAETEAETEAGIDGRPETRSDARLAARSETRVDARTDASSGARPEARSEARPDTGSVARPEWRSDARSGARPEGRSDARIDGRSDARSEGRNDARIDARSEGRNDARIDARPDERPGNRPATRPGPSGRPASAGLASLQLRGISAAPSGPRLRRLGSEPAAPPSEPERNGEPRPRARELVTPPEPPPVVRPPIALAVASLAPRTLPTRCSAMEYHVLLEQYRRFASATALRAIAHDWDSGRLAFSTHDRPPFEAEVLGIIGRRSGLAPARVVEAAEALDEATISLGATRAQLAGRLSPLDLICIEHRVGKLGELVLLFVAAPALWGELTRLYGILSNDSGRATCDEHLLWQLLGHTTSRRELARELDPDSPLVRHGLIQVNDRGRPFQALAANPIVVKLLAGSTVEDDVEHGVARVPARVALDDLMLPPAVIDRALADLAAAPPGLARIVITGRSGSGRRTFLATLAELAGRTLATIDAAMLIREKRVNALAGLLQHAHLRGWLPCVDGLETIPSDDGAARGTVRELLRDHHGPLAVRLPRHVQPPVEPGYVMIELPTSTISDRAAQWSEILAGAGMAVRDLDELAARFTVGPGTIRNVVTQVARGNPVDADHAIETALRQYLETKLGAVATRVTRLASWAQIVLPADIHDSIVELVARIRHRRTVYDTWGFEKVMSTSRGLTALFQGGPGTGKTLVASAIANELGLDLYRIDLSRVMSKWIGETEQNLAKVFDAAEEGQALILFDEADSLFGKRTEVRTSVDRYANLETNYLLQRLDTFEGVAVLTTNFGTAIDAAFKRRLSCRLTFPFPDEEARERLWRVHLPAELPLAGKLDLADLARRYKMSGGYIRNAALRAAFLAAEEQAPLSQDHLERAVRAEFREGGKLAESGFLE